MSDRRTLMLIVMIIGLVLTAASAVVLTGGRSDGVLTLSAVAIPATIPAAAGPVHSDVAPPLIAEPAACPTTTREHGRQSAVQ